MTVKRTQAPVKILLIKSLMFMWGSILSVMVPCGGDVIHTESICLAIAVFLERGGELIGAGGGLEAATDAGKTRNGFLYGHADEQTGYALGVAGTAARKLNLADHAVLNIHVNFTRANASGGIGNVFHNSSFLGDLLNAQSV